MKKIAGGLLVAFSLIGCGEEVHTVEWYKEHKEERDKKIKECKNNPGELDNTPNCINATQAEALINASKRQGIDFKPLNIPLRPK